jgi:hypothetical protein
VRALVLGLGLGLVLQRGGVGGSANGRCDVDAAVVGGVGVGIDSVVVTAAAAGVVVVDAVVGGIVVEMLG